MRQDGDQCQRVRETGKLLPCSHAVATLDEKSMIVVDEQAMQEVLFAEKVQKIGEY
jgi:hypothetical protein